MPAARIKTTIVVCRNVSRAPAVMPTNIQETTSSEPAVGHRPMLSTSRPAIRSPWCRSDQNMAVGVRNT